MATKQPGVWGIDLGQCALKAIRLEKIDGQVTATAFDYVEHPKILSQPDADPDQLIREALEKFLSRNELRGDLIAISVPGQSGLARFVKLPPVEEKKITDIVRFEAKQQIPFPLDEVVWDFQKIGSGVVSDGFALETEIGLFAMKRNLVNRYLQHFKDVGVEVHIVQMAPLALCNYVSHDLISKPEEGEDEEDEEAAGKKKSVVALDIGADSSNLVITDGDKIIWQRPIPLGGNHFTRALTKDLKLTFAKAEHVKRNAVKSPDLRKILASLKPVLNDFVSEVQRSLGYFTNTHRDAHVQYMIGLGNAFRLPGLQKYLQEKLQLEVRRLQRLNRMTGDAVTAAPQFTENIPSFAVAYGLALQGLGEPRLQTNLLPHEIRFERMVRAKKPWAAAAVAALVLAVAGLAFGRATEWRAVHNTAVDKALAEGKRVKDEATRIQTAYNENQQKVIASEKAVKNISGGVDERFNWNLFYKYVNDALPQPFPPDKKRLAERARSADQPKEMYDTPEAKAAFQEWLNKQFVKQGAPVLKAEKEREIDAKIKDNLIQINITSINQEWKDDLFPFYKKIIADAKDRPAILGGLEEWEKQDAVKEAPEKLPKSGWVIEIRGSTYHHEGARFVLNTLLENLARPDNVGNNYQDKATKLLAQVKQTDEQLNKLRGQLKKVGAKKDETAEPKKEEKVDQKKKAALDALQQQIKREEEERQDLEQQWKIADQLKKGVQDRRRFMVLYRADTVRASAPPLGSVLPDVLGGGKTGLSGTEGKRPNMPTAGKAGGPMTAPPKGAGTPGTEDSSNKEADRSGWVPLGDIAAGVLAGTAAEAPAAGPGQAQRVDFSILLVWQEPLPAGEAAPETPAEPKQ